MRRILLLASLFALASVAPVSAGLVNGSFEPPAAPGAPAAIPGWLANGAGVEWLAAPDGAAPSGERVVRLAPAPGSDASLAQSFATEPGQAYDLVFWLGGRADAHGRGRARVRVDVAGVHRSLAISNRAAELLWQPQAISFVATGSVTTLAFRAVPGRDAAPAWLDGVAVRPAASALVTTPPVSR